MIAHGHQWREIQAYDIDQIRLFLRAIDAMAARQFRESLQAIALGMSGDQNAIAKVLNQ